MRDPTCTEILSLFGYYGDIQLSPQHRQSVYDRGTLVGKAANWLALGQEPPWKREPDPSLHDYVSGYKLFLREHVYKLEALEPQLQSRVYRFIVHPDQVGTLDTRKVLLEIKTGTYNQTATRLQTAAQQIAWAEANPGQEIRRLCLLLPGDGTYKLYPHGDPGDKRRFLQLVSTAHQLMADATPLGETLREMILQRKLDGENEKSGK